MLYFQNVISLSCSPQHVPPSCIFFCCCFCFFLCGTILFFYATLFFFFLMMMIIIITIIINKMQKFCINHCFFFVCFFCQHNRLCRLIVAALLSIPEPFLPWGWHILHETCPLEIGIQPQIRIKNDNLWPCQNILFLMAFWLHAWYLILEFKNAAVLGECVCIIIASLSLSQCIII